MAKFEGAWPGARDQRFGPHAHPWRAEAERLKPGEMCRFELGADPLDFKRPSNIARALNAKYTGERIWQACVKQGFGYIRRMK